MRDAGIDDPRDVHFVQIKCPLLTSERIEAALHRGRKTVTTSGLYVDGLFARRLGARRRAGAGRIKGEMREDQMLKDWDLFSSVASSSAGIELMHNVVIVMGNSRGLAEPVRDRPCGDARIHRSCRGHRRRSTASGSALTDAQANGRLVNIFAKAEASPTAACAASATPCSTIPMSARRATPAPRSADWSAGCPEPARSMCRAAPSTRDRPAAARSRSSRAYKN